MTASYPGTLKTFTTKVDVIDRVMSEHPNSLQDEVIAVETILGLNPQISSTSDPLATVHTTTFSFATVSARIANLENGIVADVHNQYVHKAGGDTIWPQDTTTVGLGIRKQIGSPTDLLRLLDYDGSVQGRVDSDFRLTIPALTVLSGGDSVFHGGGSFTGEVSAPSLYLAGTNPTTIPLTIKLANNQTADALQVRSFATNSPSVRIDANGALYVTDLTVAGHLVSGPNTGNAFLDLSAVTGASGASGTGQGDKIALHADHGFGVQDRAMVAYLPSGARFAVRRNPGSGVRSAGPDAVTLGVDGTITAHTLNLDGALSAGGASLGPTSTTDLTVTGLLRVASGSVHFDAAVIDTVSWTQATSLSRLDIKSTSAVNTGLVFSDSTLLLGGGGGGAGAPVLRAATYGTKTVKALNGELQILNSAGAVIFRVDENGNATATRSMSSLAFNAPGFTLTDGNIELGNHGGVAYIDFHNSTAPDFDARIIGIGDSKGANGGSNIDVTAANTNFYSNVVLTDHKLYARASGDANHWAGYAADVDGWKFQSNTGFAFDNLAGGLKRLATLTNSGLDLGSLSMIAGEVYARGSFRMGGRLFGPVAGQGHVLNDKTGHAVELVWNDAIDHLDVYVDSQLVSSTHRGTRLTGGISKTFVIDHPVDPDRYLVHTAVEGPTADVFYRGEATVGSYSDGYHDAFTPAADVVLPGYFEKATLPEGRTVQLTVVDSAGFPVVKASRIANGAFTIYASAPCTVAWEVKAVRADVTPYEVEPLKSSKTLIGSGPYVWLQ